MEAGAKSQEGQGAQEGKAQAAGGDEDLSMEEILQSIRRIIAEDDKDPRKAEAGKAKGKAKDDEVPGSDVFELTEMIKDDGSVVNVKAEAAKEAAVKQEAKSADVLNKIDEALTAEKKPAEAAPAPANPEPKPEPKVEAKPEPAAPAKASQDDIDAMFSAVPPPPPPPVVPVVSETPADSLLSAQAAAASIAALDKLKAADQYVPPAPVAPAPAFRDGTTVEDLVTEMLRPMMKTWLDNNLPQLVERIVEREIRKLTK